MKIESLKSSRMASFELVSSTKPVSGSSVGSAREQRRDRKLALPVDARVDDALLVDLELEP